MAKIYKIAKQYIASGVIELTHDGFPRDAPRKERETGAFEFDGVRYAVLPWFAFSRGWIEMYNALRKERQCPTDCPGTFCTSIKCYIIQKDPVMKKHAEMHMRNRIQWLKRKRQLVRMFNTELSK